MFKGLPSLQKLVNRLHHVPYLASKNLYRVAFHFLNSDQEQVEQLCTAILNAKQNIVRCRECCGWTEGADMCAICIDPRRDTGVLCVVETWHDLFAIERGEQFTGRYHVLNGALSPLEGIGPEDLTVDVLVNRLKAGGVNEVIFATNPTPEGEATASFILTRIKGLEIRCSRLASGMPTGSHLAYMDRMTIAKALQGRQPL